MPRVLGEELEAFEIDGNLYHLPKALSPGTKIKVHKQVTAFTKADEAETIALRELGAISKKVDADPNGDGALDKGYLDAEKALKVASETVAKAARALIVELLQPTGGATKPEDLGESIPDIAAVELAGPLARGGRIEPDPTSSAS